jgi:energy-coupling factor transporter ATP-binding protein EcfA2
MPGPLGTGSRRVLEARGIAVVPPGASRPVVEGISLSVGPGEWVALAGENGGGKSSLLLALAGLWPVAAGTLTLNGRAFGPAQREAAGVVTAAILQDPSSQILQPTVAEELAFAARNLDLPDEFVAREVARRAREFDLEPDLARDPATLSAGRQQQVLLAAALVTGPRVLFADEPTAHLDAAARERTRELIRRETAGGMAVVWATQDPEEIRAATRTLEVGRAGDAFAIDEDRSGWPGIDPVSSAVLRIRIAVPMDGPGPRVWLAAPLEVAIGPAGVTAWVGPNGAGKSVLLSAVAGLEPLAQVAVEWQAPPTLPAIMALQYPELQVFEDQVADELAFAATARGMERSQALAEAHKHLRELGFDDKSVLSRRTWTLSTGEKRLIEVVGALIAPASLVILDEPTAGLDPGRRTALAGLVRGRADEGPVMIASQDVGWLENVGGRQLTLGLPSQAGPNHDRKRD